MPSITGGDQDGVDFLAREQFFMKPMRRTIPVAMMIIHEAFSLLAARPPAIAHRQTLHFRLAEEVPQIIQAAIATADDSESDSFARRGPVIPAQRRRRDHIRYKGRGGNCS
ncbi:hypothetical protein AMJ85_05690 [candidate division BRC1 bacterium SM23_51]|nr:MAG: hypothetical protein AMJ85_05690 [candidate division BRC1 bacterium SM23_51]